MGKEQEWGLWSYATYALDILLIGAVTTFVLVSCQVQAIQGLGLGFSFHRNVRPTTPIGANLGARNSVLSRGAWNLNGPTRFNGGSMGRSALPQATQAARNLLGRGTEKRHFGASLKILIFEQQIFILKV